MKAKLSNGEQQSATIHFSNQLLKVTTTVFYNILDPLCHTAEKGIDLYDHLWSVETVHI